eukprot:8731142-Pyramimonas_sp.AAC.1
MGKGNAEDIDGDDAGRGRGARSFNRQETRARQRQRGERVRAMLQGKSENDAEQTITGASPIATTTVKVISRVAERIFMWGLPVGGIVSGHHAKERTGTHNH